MKKTALLLVLFNFVFASSDYLKNMTLIELFNNKYYSYICNQRWKFINKYNNKREDLLSLVAYACLKKRFLTPALDLAKVLKVTKEGRKNATYIVTLFLMKKLIMQMIDDNLQIGDITLPQISDNTLGKVFGLIQKGDYEKKDGALVVKNGNTTYKVWISDNYNVVIDTVVNGELTKREYYW
ncbi:hypothetical protein [Nautilia sp.]